MDEIGIVKQTAGTSAQIELERTKQCKHCGLCIPSIEGRMLLVDIENTVNAQPGDKVRLALSGGNIIIASLIVYGLPLLGLILGSIAGNMVFERIYSQYKFLPVLGAGIGLICGFVIGFIVDKISKRSGKYNPRIVEKLT